MELVQKSRQPASLDSVQYWAVWAVRLLILVLILQAGMLLSAFLNTVSPPHRPPGGRAVEVVAAPGTQRPQVPRAIDVRSYTQFYVDGMQIQYSPEDLTDAVEYAVNYLAGHPAAKVRIVRTVSVVRGKH